MADEIIFQVTETPISFTVLESPITFQVVESEAINFVITEQAISFPNVSEQIAFSITEEVLQFTIEAGIQGEPGISEDEMVYAKRVDFITDSILYRGEAVVGSAESAAAWRIRKITIASDSDVTEVWADGVATFTKVWDNRASYTYS